MAAVDLKILATPPVTGHTTVFRLGDKTILQMKRLSRRRHKDSARHALAMDFHIRQRELRELRESREIENVAEPPESISLAGRRRVQRLAQRNRARADIPFGDIDLATDANPFDQRSDGNIRDICHRRQDKRLAGIIARKACRRRRIPSRPRHNV